MIEDAPLRLCGVRILPGHLSVSEQGALVEDLRAVARVAPFFHPATPGGQKMRVRMTSAGSLGWIADAGGYRYAPRHPKGGPWPEIPQRLLRLWHEITGLDRAPDTCLINYYDAKARMGLHQDRDEADFNWPVVSVSLGDDALFRVGGLRRNDPTRSIWLQSGDVAVLEGAARRAFHGIDRLRPGSSALLSRGGRINVTMRVAG